VKAIAQDEYVSPDVLELKEIDTPEVKDDEQMVRVRAAAVAASRLARQQRQAVHHAHHVRAGQTREQGSGQGCREDG
jgi:NADPH:quinone reductase-like Zn-dependent oxidoreductase